MTKWKCEECGLVYFKNVGRCNGSYETGVCKGKLRQLTPEEEKQEMNSVEQS